MKDKKKINIKKKKKKLRTPLEFREDALLLLSKIKKKDSPGLLYKSSTDNKSYFDKKTIFTIIKSKILPKKRSKNVLAQKNFSRSKKKISSAKKISCGIEKEISHAQKNLVCKKNKNIMDVIYKKDADLDNERY